MSQIAHLPDRAVLEIAGDDRVSFLQGLVSNDVARAIPGQAIWAALLTPRANTSPTSSSSPTATVSCSTSKPPGARR